MDLYYKCIYNLPLITNSEGNSNYDEFVWRLYDALCLNGEVRGGYNDAVANKCIEGYVDYPITNLNLNCIEEVCRFFKAKIRILANYYNDDGYLVSIRVKIDSDGNICVKEWWNAEDD